MADTESYTDLYIRQMVRVENLKEGEADKMARMLRVAHSTISERLERWDTPWQLNRLTATLEGYQTTLESAWTEDIVPELLSDGLKFTQKQSVWHFNTLDDIVVAPVAAVPPTVAFEVAQTEPFQGKLMAQWAIEQPRGELARARNVLVTDWLQGLSPRASVANLRPVMNMSTNHLKTLTRSYFGHLSATVTELMYQENDDIVEGKIWVSTLDHRTTREYCIPRDNLKYGLDNRPIGHTFPWLEGPGEVHWNCRSASVPLLEGVDETYLRPAIGAGPNYQKGDRTRDNSRKVRPFDKKSREAGIFEAKRVQTDTTYLEWLARQPVAFQEDVLGVARAADFRAGRLDFRQGFVPVNPTTVDNF